MSKQLLLEIGTEEIPAGALSNAFEDIKRLAKIMLEDNRIGHGNIKVIGTPRRIVLVVDEIEEKQPDLVEEKMGPPVKAAFDDDGNPKPAATGFAKKVGLPVEDLLKIDTPKGQYLAAKISTPGRETREVLAEQLPQIIRSIPWRKSMRWGDGTLTFSRPIQWILALFGSETVSFELEGIKSGNTTRGHRFMKPDTFEVTGYDDYAGKLKEASVMVDHEERRREIEKGVRKKASELGGEPASFADLFDEVTFLVEWPVVISASFPEKYLEVPAQAIIAAMVGHQRYFPLKDKDGKLLNHFVTVANTPARNPDVVAQGNARVLNARLADAEFFYRQDLKKPPEKRVEDLRGVIFLKEVGSYFEKTKRIEILSKQVADWVLADPSMSFAERLGFANNVARAALLAKTDLTTEMVGEFPSLQGTMGGIYTRAAGEPEEVAKAVEEHYLPRSASDIDTGVLPGSKEGACVAVADRADSLAACFAAGLAPKGDQDPYALRRSVLGILAIIRGKSLRIPIGELVSKAVALVEGKSKRPGEELIPEITEFIKERIRQQAIASGAAPDTVEAVLRSGYDDYLDVLDKTNALTEFRKREDFQDLAVSFRRVGNILEGIHKDETDEKLFNNDAERDLYWAFQKLKDKVEDRAAKRNYLEALELIAELRPQVDKFFDDVLVNDPKDEPRKINRHTLLACIHKMFLKVADFSAISG